jgi:hypothetical protein
MLRQPYTEHRTQEALRWRVPNGLQWVEWQDKARRREGGRPPPRSPGRPPDLEIVGGRPISRSSVEPRTEKKAKSRKQSSNGCVRRLPGQGAVAAQRCPRAALALGRPCFSLAELAQSGTSAFKAKAEHRRVRAPPPSAGGALTRRWISADTPSAPRAVGVSIPRLYLGAPETNCYSMCR